ncbi:YopX family protein [Cytobacillus sp. FSL R7-0696]|uniref:YopX family protein n=1 Tax=Cytobacillus sp. FSL R7-0696 TaxID=2921691 RepID=UPI0030F940F2
MSVREIKLQAWLGHCMVQVTSLNLMKNTKGEYESLSTGYFVKGENKGSHTGFYLESAKLRQFTSLLDKNGREIYEGDVVKFHYKRGIYKIGPVVWNYMFGSWNIDCAEFVAYKSLGQFNSVSEVIGNIYENPELFR